MEKKKNKIVSEEESRLTEQESKTFYIFKAFAILLVIAAHTMVIIENHGIWTFAVSTFWSMISHVGAVSFFFISGFFYRRSKGDSVSFWKKKFIGLIVPWLVCSFCIFTVLAIFGDASNFVFRYVKYFLGVHTWYYYVTVLLLLFIIFKFIGVNDIALYLCMAFNVLSLGLDMFNRNGFSEILTTPYLNVFNWIGFFAGGVLVRKYRLDRVLVNKKWLIAVFAVWSIIVAVLFYVWKVNTDFHLFAVAYKVPFIVMLFYASYALSRYKKIDFWVMVGKNTYFIYLTHMVIVQPICGRLPLFLEVINPLVGFAVMVALVVIIRFFCKKILKWEFPLTLIGLSKD